jgi:hypothetical protein
MGILMENIYIQDNIKIIHGDSVEVLKELFLE